MANDLPKAETAQKTALAVPTNALFSSNHRIWIYLEFF